MKKTILIVILALLILLPLTLALDLSAFNIFQEKYRTKDFWAGVWENKIKTPIGFSDSEFQIWGYNFPATGRWAYLREGFFAAIWLYIAAFALRAIAELQRRAEGKRYIAHPLREMGKTEWLNTISGRFWKIPIFAVGFFVLMQFPLINRFLQIITLEFYFESFVIFKSSFFLAFITGALPAIFEKLWKKRVEVKGEKMLTKTAKLYSTVKSEEK